MNVCFDRQWKCFLSFALLACLALGPVAGLRGQESQQANLPVFTEEREAAALVFLKKHRPELVQVMSELKEKQPGEYERAIRDIFRTSESLVDDRQQNPEHYRLRLEAWRAEMLLKLLAAQLIHGPAEAHEKLQMQLRQTIAQLIELQIAQADLQVRQGEARLEQMRQRKQQLAAQRDELVEQRAAAILRQIEEHRQQRQDAADGR